MTRKVRLIFVAQSGAYGLGRVDGVGFVDLILGLFARLNAVFHWRGKFGQIRSAKLRLDAMARIEF